MRRTVSSSSLQRICASLLFLVVAPPLRADWFRDFDDGTTQGLVEFDVTHFLQGIDEFSASNVSGSLRMQFHGGGTLDDSGVMYDPEVTDADLSALVRIRFSNNLAFAATPFTSEINAGFIIRYSPVAFRGYILLIDDLAHLQLWKLTPSGTLDICPEGQLYNTPGFDPSTDCWIRFEAQDNGAGGLILRGRIWADGTPEPCAWQVACVDESNPYPSGVVGLLVNEDAAGNGQYIDLDDASVSSQFSCVELCNNGLDDDQDGLMDCADPDCGAALHCQCSAPFADLDGDGDVDHDDFGRWQLCFTGTGFTGPHDDVRCDCLDRDDMDGNGTFDRFVDGDGDIDMDDFAAFAICASGPAVAAAPGCGH